MGVGRRQLDYGRVIAGEHVTHADARVPFASSRNSASTPPSFIACVTRDAGLLLTGFHHTASIFTPALTGCRIGAAALPRASRTRPSSMGRKYGRRRPLGAARRGFGEPWRFVRRRARASRAALAAPVAWSVLT